nr:Chain A, Defensin-1 [Centruroides limpidus]
GMACQFWSCNSSCISRGYRQGKCWGIQYKYCQCY